MQKPESLFRLIAEHPFGVFALESELNKNAHLFKAITARQEYSGTAHADTETIFLRWCKGADVQSAFTDLEAVDYPFRAMLPRFSEIIDMLAERIGAEKIGRAIIVKLKPGGFITPHSDEGAYADHYERFHLVITSEPGNFFINGTEVVEMKQGEVWTFAHRYQHAVINNSKHDRVHLILDLVAPKYRVERPANEV